jgi:hypothetical protein
MILMSRHALMTFEIKKCSIDFLKKKCLPDEVLSTLGAR